MWNSRPGLFDAHSPSKIVLSATLVVSGLLLTSCSAASSPAVPIEQPAETTAHVNSTTAALDTSINIELLDLTAQEDTFLQHIESAISVSADELQARETVELDSPDNTLWQGERHAYSDRDVFFLQQAHGDGATAVTIEGPSGTEISNISAMLPDDSVPGDAPDVTVQFVQIRQSEDGRWSFSVTLQHPDTGWEDYTDGWQVETVDGAILGVRILMHPHVNEQPFTRSLSGITIPDDIEEVRIRAHDLVSGYGPDFVAVPIRESSTGELYSVSR